MHGCKIICPSIPIPRLYGFGLSTGERVWWIFYVLFRDVTHYNQFTVLENLSLATRLFQSLRRQWLTWFGYQIPSRYIRHQGRNQIPDKLDTGYLLIEYIEGAQSKMLSETWIEKRREANLRMNLFRGLSQILLAIGRVPLPRIGSFTIDANGFLNLTYRPLTLEIHELENEQIPVDIPRDVTYSTVDSKKFNGYATSERNTADL